MGEETQAGVNGASVGPAPSVITVEMVVAAMAYFKANHPDNFAGIYGTLKDWERGVGELDAHLVEAPSRRELFAPLFQAYFKAKGTDVPDYTVDTEDAEEGKE